MQVKDVLSSKGSQVATIDAGATVSALLDGLAEHKVGALLIVDGHGAVTGIVSERDVVRQLQQRGPSLLNGTVGEIMTTDVVTCSPSDDIRDLMQLLTERRFRHLPVVQDGVLCGIVSIGDVVKARVEALQAERDHLESYISGN